MLREPLSYSRILSVTAVKNYVLCPLIPWIQARHGLHEDPTISMETGRMSAEEKMEIAEKLGLPRPYVVEKRLYSARLGLAGTVDLIAGRRSLVVLEAKRYRRRRRLSRHFIAQLMVYALLVNDIVGPVREAILYLGGSVLRFQVTGEWLAEAERLVRAAWRAVSSEQPPRSSVPARLCRQCWYRRVCPRMAETVLF